MLPSQVQFELLKQNMVSTRKKRRSNRKLLSQLDDFDQDIVIGNTANERQEIIAVSEGIFDQDFTVGASCDNLATNENTVIVKTLGRCFNERIDREMSNIVDTVEVRIQNAILAAIYSFVAPMIELEIRSKKASSGQDATNVTTNSERGQHVGMKASSEDESRNKNVLHKSNVNDEARNNIPDKVIELSVPEIRFDRPTHTHHFVTGQTTRANQIPEFLSGRISTPRNPPSHQYQKMSTQASQDNNLPMVEQTPRNQNSDANNSIDCLVDAIAAFATQQQLQRATMLKPVSNNTIIFDGKNEKFELFEDLFHTKLKMQPEMREAMKINQFHAHLQKEALQIFGNISASNRKTLIGVLFVFRRKFVKPESQATAKHK